MKARSELQKSPTQKDRLSKNGSAALPTDFSVYGAESIRKALGKMMSLVESVRQNTDVEAVHDIRVASRRLRAAISVFEPAFGGRPYARFQKHVKTLTGALSDARDLDVMIGAVTGLGKTIPPPARMGVDEYRDHLTARRARLQKKVQKSLAALETANLAREFSRIASDAEATSDSMDHDPERQFGEAIDRRVNDLRRWEQYVADAHRVHELHQMRIAAKRLRYTMELFAPFRGPLFATAIDGIRRIQERLGRIHDADVLAPALLQHLRSRLSIVKKSGADGVYAADIPALSGLMTGSFMILKEREAEYEKFLSEWKDLQAAGLLDHILRMAEPSAPELSGVEQAPAAGVDDERSTTSK